MVPIHLKIAEEVRDNIDFRDDKTTRAWINEYDKFNLTEKIDFFRYMEKSQGIYIRYAMKEIMNPISLLGLGSFYYKQSRKDFYDIREQNPKLSDEEVVEKVKTNYWNRIQKKETIESKSIVVKKGNISKKSKELVLSIKK